MSSLKLQRICIAKRSWNRQLVPICTGKSRLLPFNEISIQNLPCFLQAVQFSASRYIVYRNQIVRITESLTKLGKVLDKTAWMTKTDIIHDMSKTKGPWYRLETFFAEEENHTWAPRWASNLWPLHVNVEILSRSPQETDDFTGMLENDEIKHKI